MSAEQYANIVVERRRRTAEIKQEPGPLGGARIFDFLTFRACMLCGDTLDQLRALAERRFREKVRRCGACGEPFHTRRTCPTREARHG
jgi:hypothetical protein